MSTLAHYVHVHLAGAAAGIDLFARSGQGMLDREVGEQVLRIHDELLEERTRLRRMADDLGVGESTALTLAARAGERVARFKPNGALLRRPPLTDLVELEAMRDAVAGKLAGWQALLAVVEEHAALDPDELEHLIESARGQEDVLATAHRRTAAIVLAG